MADRFSIAQVTPFPWEAHHEVNTWVQRVSDELCARGHRVLVIAPSESPDLVRESRRRIREARDRPEALFEQDGCVSVLGVGEVLGLGSTRGGGRLSMPLDVARTIEDLLAFAPLDFVHVHEPFAPSAPSVALRHSRALNVGTFHAPAERVLSAQIARRFVELFFGRLDARLASWTATAELVRRYFPADYEVIEPGSDCCPPVEREPGPLRILYCAEEERAAERAVPARAAPAAHRRWSGRPSCGRAARSTSASRAPRCASACASPARATARRPGTSRGADVVVAGSLGAAPAPQLLLDAIAAGAVPVAARLPVYEDALRDGIGRAALRARRRRDARRPARASRLRRRPARPARAPGRGAPRAPGLVSHRRRRRGRLRSASPRGGTTRRGTPRCAPAWRNGR